MRHLLFTMLLLLILAICGLSETDLPPELLLELSDDASAAFRLNAKMPRDLETLSLKDARLIPVFKEPHDPAHRETWYELGMNRWFKLVAGEERVDEIATRISRSQEILNAELCFPGHPTALPNDFEIHDLWGLEKIRCPEAWEICHGDSGIIISTIDGGCDIFHPDLIANIRINPGEDLNGNGIWDDSDENGIDDDDNGYIDDIAGWDFALDFDDNEVFPDTKGHGTHVAGIAAAVTDNGIGVASASWNVKSMPLRAAEVGIDESYAYPSDFAEAVQYAVDNGARIISISFSDISGSALQSAFLYARRLNTLIFASAGNSGIDFCESPASNEGVVAVAATDRDDKKAVFSNYNTRIDLCAPGVEIWSTMSNNELYPVDYASWQGTSMAAPMAASVAALVLSRYPSLSDDELEAALIWSCDDISEQNPEYESKLGAGRINAESALLLAPRSVFPIPQICEITTDRYSGRVDISWDLPIIPLDDELQDFHVYRNRQLLNSTLNTFYTDTLSELGAYTYQITAHYRSGESLPGLGKATWEDVFGLPFKDSFEEGLVKWRVVEYPNTEITLVDTPVIDGLQAVAVSSMDNTQIAYIKRVFDPEDSLMIETWFNLGTYPIPGSGCASLVLISASELKVILFINSNGNPSLQIPHIFTMDTVDPNVALGLDQWYKSSIHYQNGRCHWMIADSDWNVLMDRIISLPEMEYNMDYNFVALGAFNLENGWNYFDRVLITRCIDHAPQHFQPVSPTNIPYALIVTDAIINNASLNVGDELAVFDGALCVGAVKVNGNWPLEMSAWGAENMEAGYTPGNEMSFRVWLKDDGSEVPVLTGYVVGDGRFGDGLFSRLAVCDEESGMCETGSALSNKFSLAAPFPNPFNSNTIFTVGLPRTAELRIRVYNILGRQVATITDGKFSAGYHRFHFDGEGMASGIYFLRAAVPGQMNELRRIVLVR